IGVTGLAISPSTLAPGATGTATHVYTVTQADIDAGGVTNTATATGQDPDGNEVSDDSGTANDNDDPTETAISQNAKISFVKSGEYNAASGTITYTFTVTNTGNVTVSGIEIDDEQIGVTGLAISPSTLAPGATGTATHVYTVT
ncbi:hypothetical protein, partial [Christiangramia aquimixticola]|uniref:DUF7507 domain-containing protein n=1 Tax=Christiangramia aquimixticola TaxID=1697558 RepID=UPI003AA88F2C